MKKLIFAITLLFISVGIFAQGKAPSEKAITKLMFVKKGMSTVNTITENLSQKMDAKKATAFKVEMDTYKKNMLDKAMRTFKSDYTASQIDAIYKECTSDKIDYTDLTNNFFAKWRRLKGEFFKSAKETFFKYQ